MAVLSPARAPSFGAAFLPRTCVMVPDQTFCFPRRTEEVVMNVFEKFLHTLRVWTGLTDASESRLTPGHGWLLPTPAEALAQRHQSDARRASFGAPPRDEP